jgi:ribosomal protein L40E
VSIAEWAEVSIQSFRADLMKQCPYCQFSNYDQATECRKCQASFVSGSGTGKASKPYLVGPQKAHEIRRKALSFIVIGLLIKVYWGGYGPWPVVDYPTLTSLRVLLDPLFLYGGILVYLTGWVLTWV